MCLHGIRPAGGRRRLPRLIGKSGRVPGGGREPANEHTGVADVIPSQSPRKTLCSEQRRLRIHQADAGQLFREQVCCVRSEQRRYLPRCLSGSVAYGIPSAVIANQIGLKERIEEVLTTPGPVVCEVILSPEQNFSPRVSSKKEPDGRIVSKPLEDMYPFLSREEMLE